MERQKMRRGPHAAAAGLFMLVAAASAAPHASASPFPSGLTNDEEKKCLATAIYFEARGESTIGQKAVAQVVINRVQDDGYPDTVCGVVFQNHTWRNRCQFSFACDGASDVPAEKRAWKKAQNIADKALSPNSVPVSGIGKATHYHATTVSPGWSSRLKRMKRIGRHVFYGT